MTDIKVAHRYCREPYPKKWWCAMHRVNSRFDPATGEIKQPTEETKMPNLTQRLEEGAAYITKEEAEKGVTLTIKDEGRFERTQSGKDQLVLGVLLGKEERRLGLPASSERALAKEWGADSAKWVGKKIRVQWGTIGSGTGRIVTPAKG